jgi:membrane protease subunit (stomatin/prohibitin family)
MINVEDVQELTKVMKDAIDTMGANLTVIQAQNIILREYLSRVLYYDWDLGLNLPQDFIKDIQNALKDPTE